LRRTFLAPNTSTSLQKTLAADAHLAEGQFLHEEQTLIKAVSDIPSRNSETNNFQNERAEFETKVNLSMKESIEAMLIIIIIIIIIKLQRNKI
jgi:uncharacterized membrane protein YvbJ